MNRLKYIAAALIFPLLIAGLMAGSSPARAQANAESSDLAYFAALMQYIRSQPTPADVKSANIPVLSTLDTALSDIYITGFITPYTGETPEQVKARLQSVPEEDRFTAVMVESYRLASNPLLLNIIHELLPLYYVEYFTTAEDLNTSSEFLKSAEIATLAAAFDSTDYAIPAPSTTGAASPSAQRQDSVDSDYLAKFAAIMQYIRSQPTPADVKSANIPVLSTLDTALSDIYVTGFITPYTGETPEQVKARLQSVPEEKDRFTAVIVESYRLASNPLLLNIIHQLLPLYYVEYFTTAEDLNASAEFLKRAEIATLADAFDPTDYHIPAPSADESADTGSVEMDRAALVALYNATDGANWSDSENWLSDKPLGEWYGVTTDEDGRVTELRLRRNQLSGNIPSELGNLSRLQSLALLFNDHLSGSIPHEMNKLYNLHTLLLYGNDLSGGIPSELGEMTNLTSLNLSQNQLSGDIPSELGEMTNLTSLNLSQNQLSGDIPSELGEMTNLTSLSLSRNQLSGTIPQDLTKLTELEVFLFHRNRLLCAPVDEAMQAWLRGLDAWAGSSCAPADSPADRAALETLYSATGGGNWNNNTDWLSGRPIREWHGVTTDASGSVTGLHMEDNGLSGSMPPSLGSLARLENLNLGGNDLSGAIPPELGDLSSLEGMWLYNNELSEPIPPELGDLARLGTLNLSSNQLMGEIPPELGSLSSLQYLRLDNNQLSGMLPQELTGLTQLVNFYFDGNAQLCASDDEAIQTWLQGIGYWQGNGCAALADRAALEALYNATGGDNWSTSTNWLSDRPMWDWHGVSTDQGGRVTGLWLSGNSLSGEIPSELGNLTSLIWLSLWNNELSGPIPPELGKLSNLQSLALDNNRLSGDIPSELGKLSNLTFLNLGANQLDGGIPPELGKLSNLTGLWLGGNQLDGGIPPELGKLSNLQGLALDNNRLSGDIPSELGKLSNLTRLYLGGNQLDGGIPSELGKLSNLQRLALDNNRLSGDIPSELGKLSNLTRLHLGGNQLDGGIPSELGKLSNLTELGLFKNQLSGEIPSELGDLSNLTWLHLDGNQLDGEIPSELGDLSNLTSLDLRGNQLSGAVPPSLGNLTNLTGLWLRENELSGTLPQELKNLTQMQHFYFEGNPDLCAPTDEAFETWLQGIENWEGTSCGAEDDQDALVALYEATDGENWGNNTNWLSDQPMRYWHGVETGRGGRVTEIRLSGNQLSGSIPPELGNLAKLELMGLWNNELSGEIPSELGKLTNLTHLDIESNELSGDVPPELGNLANLETLWLSSNQLSGAIPPELGNLTNLQYLYLDFNQFHGAIPSALGSLVKLDLLDLQYNRLSGTLPQRFTALSALEQFSFHGNRNLCAPVDEKFQAWLLGIAFMRGSSCAPVDSSDDRAILIGLYEGTDGTNWRDDANWLSDQPLRTWHGVTTDAGGRVTGLYIGDNGLSGEIPSSLGNLTRLTRLDFWSNDLSGEIPGELGSLTDLILLELGRNDLSGEIPPELGNLSRLEKVSVSGNRLSGEIPPELGNLSSLTGLWLRENQLSGEIPPELGKLFNLQRLYLNDNELTGSIPSELGNLSNLGVLRVSDNDLSGDIPSELGNLTDLWSLYLAGNQLLTGCVPEALMAVGNNDFDDLGLPFCS